jgi:hypothetical protein
LQVLKTEVHEGTLVIALTNLEKWALKVTSEIPSEFIEWLPKGIALKTATSTVKCAYFSCLSAAMKSSTSMQSSVSLIPTLMSAVTTSVKQPTQISEGAIAASCLVKLSSLEGDVEAKLEDFWKIILDTSKSLFVNERFLISATPAALVALTSMAERVLTLKQDLCSNQSEWARSIVVSLLCSSLAVRRHAKCAVQKIVGGLTGNALAELIIKEVDLHISSPSISLKSVTPLETAEPCNSVINAKYVIDALDVIVKGVKFEGQEDKSLQIAKGLLNPCHQALIKATYKDLWKHLIVKMKLNVGKTIEEMGDVVQDVLEGRIRPESVSSLIKYNPQAIVPRILELLNRNLIGNPELFITVEEYAIYQTPRGEIFDKEVLESIHKNNDMKNVKRESKAYSYKEQMEELALRKEIEEKRRREGKSVPVKLTPKQKELIDTQLEKEDVVRKKVEALRQVIGPLMNVAKIALESNPGAFKKVLNDVASALFSGFRSPVSALDCCETFRLLRKSVFDREDETLAQIIASTVIKIKDPSCLYPDPPANSSILTELTKSVTLKIGEATVESMAEDADMVCPFNTPAFSYAFPVVDFAIKKSLKDDEFILKTCDIIDEHAKLRGSDEENDYHPKWLPIHSMLEAIITIIEKTEGRSQQRGVASLVEIASAASGQVSSSCTKVVLNLNSKLFQIGRMYSRDYQRHRSSSRSPPIGRGLSPGRWIASSGDDDSGLARTRRGDAS